MFISRLYLRYYIDCSTNRAGNVEFSEFQICAYSTVTFIHTFKRVGLTATVLARDLVWLCITQTQKLANFDIYINKMLSKNRCNEGDAGRRHRQDKCNELGSSVKGDTGHLCAGVWKRGGSQPGGWCEERGPVECPQRTAPPHNTFSDYDHVFLYRMSTGRFRRPQLAAPWFTRAELRVGTSFVSFRSLHASLIVDYYNKFCCSTYKTVSNALCVPLLGWSLLSE